MKFCETCGKEIMEDAVVCTSCGCTVAQQAAAPGQVAVPKKAKMASVMGILGLLLLAPLGIAAIVLANQSKKETGGILCKQAKTGLVCGILALCFWGFMLVVNFI